MWRPSTAGPDSREESKGLGHLINSSFYLFKSFYVRKKINWKVQFRQELQLEKAPYITLLAN